MGDFVHGKYVGEKEQKEHIVELTTVDGEKVRVNITGIAEILQDYNDELYDLHITMLKVLQRTDILIAMVGQHINHDYT